MKKTKLEKRTIKMTPTFSKQDRAFLLNAVATLENTYSKKTNHSELIALGLSLLKQKSLKDIAKLL